MPLNATCAALACAAVFKWCFVKECKLSTHRSLMGAKRSFAMVNSNNGRLCKDASP